MSECKTGCGSDWKPEKIKKEALFSCIRVYPSRLIRVYFEDTYVELTQIDGINIRRAFHAKQKIEFNHLIPERINKIEDKETVYSIENLQGDAILVPKHILQYAWKLASELEFGSKVKVLKTKNG